MTRQRASAWPADIVASVLVFLLQALRRASGRDSRLLLGAFLASLAGYVVSDVTGWEVAAPVAVEPLVTCRACRYCLQGDYQVCARRRLLGVGQDGGLADYVRVPAYTLSSTWYNAFTVCPAVPNSSRPGAGQVRE